MSEASSDFLSRVDAQVREQLMQPGVRVRLNNETYIRYMGDEHLVFQNAYAEDALSIKYDILLIIYELINWCSVQELIAPWPPEDQTKIVDYLAMFYQSSMLLIEGQPKPGAANSPEVQSGKAALNKVPINVENHHNMLKDHVRMVAYRRAIERVVKPGDVVLDIGCGSGILSFFAQRAGASQVFAVEKQAHILLMAQELAKANGMDKVTFIEGLSTLIAPEKFTPKPNVLVSEIIGDGILEENVLEYTLDARDRLLAPGARLLPARLEICGFGFYGPSAKGQQLQEVETFQDLYGLDFDILGQILASKATLRRERYHPQLYQGKTEAVSIHTLDFATLQQTNFSVPIELVAKEDGPISGLCLYFKAWLDEETVLTNAPWAPQTHWTHLLYTFAEPLKLKAGETLKATLIYDGALRVSLLEEASESASETDQTLTLQVESPEPSKTPAPSSSPSPEA